MSRSSDHRRARVSGHLCLGFRQSTRVPGMLEREAPALAWSCCKREPSVTKHLHLVAEDTRALSATEACTSQSARGAGWKSTAFFSLDWGREGAGRSLSFLLWALWGCHEVQLFLTGGDRQGLLPLGGVGKVPWWDGGRNTYTAFTQESQVPTGLFAPTGDSVLSPCHLTAPSNSGLWLRLEFTGIHRWPVLLWSRAAQPPAPPYEQLRSPRL